MKGVDRLAASVARKIVFACAKAEIFFLFFPKLYTRIEKYHEYCWSQFLVLPSRIGRPLIILFNMGLNDNFFSRSIMLAMC